MNIQKYTIAEQMNTLLDGLGDEEVGLYSAVERKLAAIAAPDVTWRTETGDTGFLRALVGRRRYQLQIEHARFTEYVVVVSARTYGTVLHVSWLLLAAPRLLNDIRRTLRLGADRESRFDIGAELDDFDILDLEAFVAVTRLALRTAIRELSDVAGDEQDHPVLGRLDTV